MTTEAAHTCVVPGHSAGTRRAAQLQTASVDQVADSMSQATPASTASICRHTTPRFSP